MSKMEENTESQLVISEAGAPQLGAGGEYQTDEIKSAINHVLNTGDFPDDKKVEISMEFMVVPRAMKIAITKK